MDAKICGIKDSKTLKYIVNHNNPPRFIGFITNYPKSKRYVEYKDLKVNYLTIHISSGLDALKAAKKVSGKIKLVGVTTLTSLNNKNLKEIGYNKSVKNLIIHQSKLAQKAKLDALVCDGKSVKYVKKILKKK